jgi:DNA-binding HxlR family transcriptional regulator
VWGIVKISDLIHSPSITILLYLAEKGEARHSQLERVIKSRGTLATNLNDLIDEGLIRRKVLPTKPIQSKYSLTEKGQAVSKLISELASQLK